MFLSYTGGDEDAAAVSLILNSCLRACVPACMCMFADRVCRQLLFISVQLCIGAPHRPAGVAGPVNTETPSQMNERETRRCICCQNDHPQGVTATNQTLLITLFVAARREHRTGRQRGTIGKYACTYMEWLLTEQHGGNQRKQRYKQILFLNLSTIMTVAVVTTSRRK